uniref:YbaK/aminoacyl-tRNA synthetase-associated domain-containing protein n=1 Tax=Aplanochytrium stocchinoi TaxID=215587 RepID=A0A7S3LP81_9STRA|mmetsp:Transcript_4746/g.5982  ORF Transcript_4746/g.5982 Transcript_4746/m.5982 type:complete len:155 (+) Transcript_4746:234-698(+)
MDTRTHEKVLECLKGKSYELLEHEETPTSEDSARVRGATLESGAKAMLVDSRKGSFALFVCSASCKINFKKIKSILGKKSQFAKEESVLDVTNCASGAVPPFGRLFGIQTYCDPSLVSQPEINFNAGLRTKSVCRLRIEDYLDVEKPTIIEFVE